MKSRLAKRRTTCTGALWLCVALVAAVAGGCSNRDGTARGAAEAFLDAHYVRIDLPASKELASGLARIKVEKELELTRDVEIDEATRQPRVNYRLERASEKPDTAQFAYELTVRAPGLEPFRRLVTVTVRADEGGWRVTNYTDGERAE